MLPIDPYQVFSQARNVWAAQRYPQYLTYTVTVRVNERGVEKSKHYHLAYDAKNAKIYVNPVSDEERTEPPDPYGFTIHLLPKRQHQTLFDKRVGNPGEAVDYLGVPMISPTYSFGMSATAFEEDRDPDALVQEIRKEFNDPTPPLKAQELATSGGLKTIAVVTGHKRAYDARFDDIEQIDGHDCYHLTLRPLYPSPRLRLRELWIDTQNYETRQLVTAGNFTGSAVPWTIDFTDSNGSMYIESETANAPVGVGDHRYQQASVTFDDVTAAQRPDALLSNWFVTKENIMAEPAEGTGPQ
jgi:hypothetical protein